MCIFVAMATFSMTSPAEKNIANARNVFLGGSTKIILQDRYVNVHPVKGVLGTYLRMELKKCPHK